MFENRIKVLAYILFMFEKRIKGLAYVLFMFKKRIKVLPAQRSPRSL